MDFFYYTMENEKPSNIIAADLAPSSGIFILTNKIT